MPAHSNDTKPRLRKGIGMVEGVMIGFLFILFIVLLLVVMSAFPDLMAAKAREETKGIFVLRTAPERVLNMECATVERGVFHEHAVTNGDQPGHNLSCLRTGVDHVFLNFTGDPLTDNHVWHIKKGAPDDKVEPADPDDVHGAVTMAYPVTMQTGNTLETIDVVITLRGEE